jgi:predicted nucleic-acid-binding protein
MIGIDSNILLRYLLDDDPVWSPRATRFIEHELSAENPAYINPVVLAETVWGLRRSPLFDRKKLPTVIEGLLEFEKFVIGERDSVVRALAAYREGPAGFADYLIAELNVAAGAGETVTTDKNAAKNRPFRRLT